MTLFSTFPLLNINLSLLFHYRFPTLGRGSELATLQFQVWQFDLKFIVELAKV